MTEITGLRRVPLSLFARNQGASVILVDVPIATRRNCRSPPDVFYWLGSREESIVDQNLTSAGRRTASERVAALIVALYKRARGLGLVAEQTFAFPLTQAHIADALGLSLVHTNKTLARLRRSGMFTRANGMLTLTNPRVLERVGQFFDEEIPLRPLI